ncbi:hypothetical protein LPJ66_005842, partial [Kickxella alabastrina]
MAVITRSQNKSSSESNDNATARKSSPSAINRIGDSIKTSPIGYFGRSVSSLLLSTPPPSLNNQEAVTPKRKIRQ